MPITVPITTDSSVARNAISSEIRAPYTIRAKMSRPLTGSIPNGWSALIPFHLPIGVCSEGSTRSWWKSFGVTPTTLQISGAKIATTISSSTTAPPARATLSRLSRIQEICHSERPSILRTPSRTASGCADDDPGSTSSGVLTRCVPLPCCGDRPKPDMAAALTCRQNRPESNAQSRRCPIVMPWRSSRIVDRSLGRAKPPDSYFRNVEKVR
jgi:hypothetical protein